MAINLATKFSKYVDESFAHESLLKGATNDKVEMTGVNEVSVYNIETMAMGDYSRSGTSRYGTVTEIGDRVQTFKIEKDRSFTGSIDEGNAQDQYNIKDASARLHVQIRDVVIPEVESYVLKQWATGAGTIVGGDAPAATTILGMIQTGAIELNNALVPKKGRNLFIGETYAAMLPNLTNLTYLDNLGTKAITENTLPRVAGFDVHTVPDGTMPANVHFILQHKDSCPFIQKLAKYKIQKDPMGIDGNVIEGRVRYWADVLGQKCKGIYVHAAAANVSAKPALVQTADSFKVTLADSTIYYTVDGSDPRYSDTRTLIASAASATVPVGAKLMAYGYKEGVYPSGVITSAVSTAT